MVSFLLQENIDELQHLADHLLHIGDKNGYVYADDLSALQQSIHEKINDLYSQRGKTPEQDATLCLAILQGYNVSMYANPEDEERKQAVLTRSLSTGRAFGNPNRILVPAPMVFRHKTLHLTAELTGKENTSGNLQQ